MMYDWPRFGLTLVNWLSATPAMPAIPEPSPKVIASTHSLRMPIALGHGAVLRDGPDLETHSRVLQHDEKRREDKHGEDHDVEAVVSDREGLVQLERAAHPGGRLDRAVERGKNRAHQLLQDEADPERREQRFQGPPVEKANDGALDQDARSAPKPQTPPESPRG